jgi:hypothetical protein
MLFIEATRTPLADLVEPAGKTGGYLKTPGGLLIPSSLRKKSYYFPGGCRDFFWTKILKGRKLRGRYSESGLWLCFLLNELLRSKLRRIKSRDETDPSTYKCFYFKGRFHFTGCKPEHSHFSLVLTGLSSFPPCYL